MEAQELRVGNTIMCQCRGEYKPHTIKSIWYNDEEKLYYVELDNGFQCNINGITPIPITKELLLKCGLLKSYYSEKIFTIEGESCVGIYYVEGKVFDIRRGSDRASITCKHLHQLQNAYYLLTGEELEIKP